MYFTLVTLEQLPQGNEWCPQFGAHDYSDVLAERSELRDHGFAARNIKILKTKTAKKSEVERKVKALNVDLWQSLHT